MLSNAYSLAKFRFDTAENEPAKNWQEFCNLLTFRRTFRRRRRRRCRRPPRPPRRRSRPGSPRRGPPCPPGGRARRARCGPRPRGRSGRPANGAPVLDRANFTGFVLGCIEAKFCKKICVGIALESSRRDLQNSLLCTVFGIHNSLLISKLNLC